MTASALYKNDEAILLRVASLLAVGSAEDKEAAVAIQRSVSELRKYRTLPDSDRLTFVEQQYLQNKSLATATVFINGLRHALAHAVEQSASVVDTNKWVEVAVVAEAIVKTLDLGTQQKFTKTLNALRKKTNESTELRVDPIPTDWEVAVCACLEWFNSRQFEFDKDSRAFIAISFLMHVAGDYKITDRDHLNYFEDVRARLIQQRAAP